MADTPAQNNAEQQPGLQVIAQYIKDFSFENPNAPDSIVGGWPQPETRYQVGLNHKPMKNDTFECTVNFHVEAKNKDGDKTCFIVDLTYCALVALKNIKKENQLAVLMVEVPKLLFPFAREIIAGATTQGGYPPLFLTPISFEQIYIQEMQRRQAESGSKGAQAATN